MATAQPSISGVRGPVRGVGTVVDRYTITGLLPEGPLGAEYLATEAGSGRTVVLWFPGELLLHAGQEAVRATLQEAKAASAVRHDNLARLLTLGKQGNELFAVSEYADGPTAAERLAGHGPMTVREAGRTVRAVAEALAAVHEAGLTHRDVRPDNIRCGDDGSVRLTRLGLVRAVEELQQLRMMGLPLASPHSASPETYRGEPADARTDVYALGATYHWLLTGRPAFEADTSLQILHKHVSEAPPDPRRVRPELPAGCGAIIAKAMAKRPADRYATAHEMAEALDDLAASLPAERGTVTRFGGSRGSLSAVSAVYGAPRKSSAAAWIATAAVMVLAVVAAVVILRSGRVEPAKTDPPPAAVTPPNAKGEDESIRSGTGGETPVGGTDPGPDSGPRPAVSATAATTAVVPDTIGEDFARLSEEASAAAAAGDDRKLAGAVKELRAFQTKYEGDADGRRRDFARNAKAIADKHASELNLGAEPDPAAGPLWLTFFAGMKDGSKTQDGVEMIVEAIEAGQRRKLYSCIVTRTRWIPHAVNLSEFRGRKVELQLTVDPRHTTGYDWACWGEPRVLRVTAPAKDGGEPQRALVVDLLKIYDSLTKVRTVHGKEEPLGDGACADLHDGDGRGGLLASGGVERAGLFIHPGWKNNHKDPTVVRWTLDLTGEK